MLVHRRKACDRVCWRTLRGAGPPDIMPLSAGSWPRLRSAPAAAGGHSAYDWRSCECLSALHSFQRCWI